MHLQMAVNEPDEFGLAAVGGSNEGLNESLSQMYHLAEDAHRQSLELKAVCAKMFEVTRMIPTHLEQLEQGQLARATETGRTSLQMLAQILNASEGLEAFVLNSSSEDWWVDVEQSFERITSAVKTVSAADKVRVNQRDIYPTMPANNNSSKKLNVTDKLKRGSHLHDRRRTEPVPKASFDLKDVFSYLVRRRRFDFIRRGWWVSVESRCRR